MTNNAHIYLAIDLKSFYASVECIKRGLDPLKTHLVVADESRTDKTICLAVSPSMKEYGISGRARLFEAKQAINRENRKRKMLAPQHKFLGKSSNKEELQNNPSLEIDFIRAVPRMAHYIAYSTKIYQIYLKYIAAEDIHVYSIDEVFMDVTNYLRLYNQTAKELASTIICDIQTSTGITATAGIGTNLYLAKVAMDILAKHALPDQNNVRIAELDELSYRKQLWDHKPLTAFWRVGHGIANRLNEYGIDTMGKIARCSVEHEEWLYKMFGVNAELLIDHAWGWEPCTIAYIKAYKPETNSLSSGQVLSQPYTFQKARNVMTEMADALSLSLVEKRMLTDQLTLTINYAQESITHPANEEAYTGATSIDYYGRVVPKHTHATANLGEFTSSTSSIVEALRQAYEKNVNPLLLIHRITLTANHIITEEDFKNNQQGIQLDLFSEQESSQQTEEQQAKRLKERNIQEAILDIKQRFGKNAILKGINYAEGATGKDRNNQIGGHKA